MSKKVKAERLYDNDGRPCSTLYQAHIGIGDICMVWAPPGDLVREANAHLIADAFNVAAKTGLTPSQLAGQRERLLVALLKYMAAFGQALEGRTIRLSQQQVEADETARAAIAEAEGATP